MVTEIWMMSTWHGLESSEEEVSVRDGLDQVGL